MMEHRHDGKQSGTQKQWNIDAVVQTGWNIDSVPYGPTGTWTPVKQQRHGETKSSRNTRVVECGAGPLRSAGK